MQKQILESLFAAHVEENLSLDFYPVNTPSVELFFECLPDEIKENDQTDLSYSAGSKQAEVSAFGFWFFKKWYVETESGDQLRFDSRDDVDEYLSNISHEILCELELDGPGMFPDVRDNY